jgi:cyclic pyranopterin phosphate synthase
MPQDLVAKLSHEEILTYEEILRLIRLSVDLGISKVRVTGGEPLVRKGVYDFLKELTRIDGLSDIAITTNAVSLKDHIKKIKSTGIKRINISLDTLNRLKYLKITGFDRFDRVWDGIREAEAIGFDPIKLNVVALRTVNDDEFINFAKLSFENPFHIRFIEYMPMGINGPFVDMPLLTHEIKERVRSLGELIPVDNGVNDGPAERYKFKGAKGEIGFISALSRHFCNTCNRLRLTASGQLRTCLLSESQIDLKGPLRKGCNDTELADIILEAARQKPSRHQLVDPGSRPVSSHMSGIGG